MRTDGKFSAAGETHARAPSGLHNRRSFLLGSAVSVGALALTGCAMTDDMGIAEAAKLYGAAPDESHWTLLPTPFRALKGRHRPVGPP